MNFKKIFLVLIIFISALKISFGEENICEKQNIFFLNSINSKTLEISSPFCDFGKTKKVIFYNKLEKKPNFLVKYENKMAFVVESEEKKQYISEVKKYIDEIKTNKNLKKLIKIKYTTDFLSYDNSLNKFISQSIFTKDELDEINTKNQKMILFKKTYGKRLLFDGKIILREQWGADENFSKKEYYQKKCPSGNCFTQTATISERKKNYIENFSEIDQKNKLTKSFTDGRDELSFYPVDRIIIHHTASPYKKTKNDGLNYMKELQKYHGLTLGWGDIGYHYLIDGEGNIYEGRAGGKYVLGAHVSGHNYGSIGISLMSDGYYSDKMLKSLEDLIVYLSKEYNLDLSQKQIVRNPNLTETEKGWVLIAHKELESAKPKDPEINMEIFREKIKNLYQKPKK